MRISDCSSDVFSSDLRRRWLGLVASGIPPPLPIIEHRLLLLADEARRRRALPWAVVTEQQRGAADPPALSRQAVAFAPDQHREVGFAVERAPAVDLRQRPAPRPPLGPGAAETEGERKGGGEGKGGTV